MRKAEISRKTRETHVQMKISLEGSGEYDINTGVGFFNHMLETLSRHSLIDMTVNASGDIHVDYHHLVEDSGIALGMAIMEALGDKKGICRYGNAQAPMDEALTEVVLDISGRPHLETNLFDYKGEIGEFNFELVEVFLSGLVSQGITIHVNVKSGKNLHHIAESVFKALAFALREAVDIDDRRKGKIPSTKEYIER